jgi:photosystem II stability/assembly factor-like uncharacterized protein
VVNEAPVLLSSNSRVWLIEGGASPANAAVYKGRARVSGITYNLGTPTAIRQPSSRQYGQFVTVGTVRGAPELPTSTIESRLDPETISELLLLANKQCEFDLQVHFGTCEDPSDFAGGWVTSRIFESVSPSTFGSSDLGTFDEGGNNPIVESLEVAAQRIYDIKKLRATEIAGTAISVEAVDIIIADSITCGNCGRTSDGCQIAFILTGSLAGSPGVGAGLLYTQDGGSTWAGTTITTLTGAPNRMAAVGSNLVVVSNAGGNHHYANINDILDGVETWSAVTAGYDAGGPPNAIVSVSPSATFIAGNGGRVYLATDPTSGVTEVADGSATAQNLTDIAALDRNNAVAVGASNAILVTTNGGTTWGLVVGPTPGVALNTVVMRSTTEWMVGTAGGELWYTRSAGATWTEKGFPGSGAGVVRHIKFASKNVGYMAHDTAAPLGRMLRTIDGGNTWAVMPEQAGLSIPDNDRINRVAPCIDDVNVVFGAGLGGNATDGFAVKFS